MKIVKLNSKQIEYFRKLDTVFMLGITTVAGGFALGGVIHDEDKNMDIPVGLMLCNQVGDTIIIEWLAIDEAYRCQGYGSEMLEKLIELADAGGIKRIEAYFRDSKQRKIICPKDGKYFRGHGFLEEVRFQGEWISDIRTLARNSDGNVLASDMSLVRLGDLPRFRIKEAIDTILTSEATDYLYAVDANTLSYDEDLSYILMKNDEIVAGLLVNAAEKFVYPACMMVSSMQECRILTCAAISQAQNKFPGDKSALVVLKTDKYLDLVTELIPGDKLGNYLLGASVENLVNMDETRNVEDFGMINAHDEDDDEEAPDIVDYIREGKDTILVLDDIANGNRLKDFDSSISVEALGYIDAMDLCQILMDCRYSEFFSLFKEIPLVPDPSWFDEDLSCCIRIKGDIACILLVTITKDGSILPVLMYANDKKYTPYLVKLMLYLKKKALEKYPGKTRIILRTADAKHVALYRSLIG